MKKLKVKLSNGAFIPTRATEGAAGLDLYSPIDVSIPPCMVYGRTARVGRYQIDTGVAIEIPAGYVGYATGRSGLAFNEAVDVHLGKIDSDFRGTIKLLLYNMGHTPVEIKRGDRIGQLVFQKIELPEPELVDTLSETERGTGGLGHTGK